MRCFIHSNVEAVSACKQCGKGMCSNCSAYSGHTGVCPACRLRDLEREHKILDSEKKWAIFWAVVSAIAAVALLFVVPILAVVLGVYAIVKVVQAVTKNERMISVQVEINKLRNALKQGTAVI